MYDKNTLDRTERKTSAKSTSKENYTSRQLPKITVHPVLVLMYRYAIITTADHGEYMYNDRRYFSIATSMYHPEQF